MSCIQRILDVKGDKDYLIFGRSAVEGGGNYLGYDYLITYQCLGYRCAYVALPEDNCLDTVDAVEKDVLQVHGDITYHQKPGIFDSLAEMIGGPVCDDVWIGFDAGHAGDWMDHAKAASIFTEESGACFEVIESVKDYYEIEKLPHYKNGKERTYEFMESECKSLIDQLIKYKKNYHTYNSMRAMTEEEQLKKMRKEAAMMVGG